MVHDWGYSSGWLFFLGGGGGGGGSIRAGIFGVKPHQQHATVAMKMKRGNMTNVSVKWNMHPSHPLILSCTGGRGPQATTSYKRLALCSLLNGTRPIA